MKIFIDTNIFLDLILKREAFDKALVLFNAVEKKRFDAVISDITILNIDYVAKKQVKNIKDFLTLVNDNFQVVGSTNEQIAKALSLKNSDLEDNLQYILAKEHHCEAIVTNDKTFYAKSVQKLSSGAFVERYLN
ncbi:MAG: PIN domain-containing protein [Campylobacterales bacterium]|nr:PIN domain-containing protein [Campylobacterales bacterium]